MKTAGSDLRPLAVRTAKSQLIAYVCLAGLFAFRFVVDCLWLLPAPTGDSGLFVTASVNYCRSGFLGTTAFAIDPTGQSRMVWHGFVSPMLFGALNVGCSSAGFFVAAWVLKLLTAVSIVLLGRKRGFPSWTTWGLTAFALAAQYQIGFRPEGLAILLIVLIELSFAYRQDVIAGALMGTLLCTQPTLAALHGLVMLLLRFELLPRWRLISAGYVTTVLILVALYPFPILDLLQGIMLQGKMLVARSDGSLVPYYLTSPWLPGWGLLFVAGCVLATVKKPLIALAFPFFWFFGPRLPPTTYNLIPICLFLVICLSAWWSARFMNALGIASLMIALLGIGMLSLRDVLTIQTYGDTFNETHQMVDGLVRAGIGMGSSPPLVALTNPALRATDPTDNRRHLQTPQFKSADLYAVSGRPTNPCTNSAPTTSSGLRLGSFNMFNSNSGWSVYVCRHGG